MQALSSWMIKEETKWSSKFKTSWKNYQTRQVFKIICGKMSNQVKWFKKNGFQIPNTFMNHYQDLNPIENPGQSGFKNKTCTISNKTLIFDFLSQILIKWDQNSNKLNQGQTKYQETLNVRKYIFSHFFGLGKVKREINIQTIM